MIADDISGDEQFKIVPGLADSNGIAFESANKPGYYLRHNNFKLVLEPNDGSALFKADATFCDVTGHGDPTWVSFKSYNFPNYYVRHSNYKLSLTTIATELDRKDATFNIGY